MRGYMGSDQILDHLYIEGWYTIADGLAKELGWRIYIGHLIRSRSYRFYLIFYYKFIYDGKLTYKRRT